MRGALRVSRHTSQAWQLIALDVFKNGGSRLAVVS
jgi:hypothetical protein